VDPQGSNSEKARCRSWRRASYFRKNNCKYFFRRGPIALVEGGIKTRSHLYFTFPRRPSARRFSPDGSQFSSAGRPFEIYRGTGISSICHETSSQGKLRKLGRSVAADRRAKMIRGALEQTKVTLDTGISRSLKRQLSSDPFRGGSFDPRSQACGNISGRDRCPTNTVYCRQGVRMGKDTKLSQGKSKGVRKDFTPSATKWFNLSAQSDLDFTELTKSPPEKRLFLATGLLTPHFLSGLFNRKRSRKVLLERSNEGRRCNLRRTCRSAQIPRLPPDPAASRFDDVRCCTSIRLGVPPSVRLRLAAISGSYLLGCRPLLLIPRSPATTGNGSQIMQTRRSAT
jgi:hypothetical protein